MTRRIITLWPAIPMILAILAACSTPPEPPAVQHEEQSAGRRAFLSRACPDCHGTQRQGTQLGPPLINVSSHWDEASLVKFLRDPGSFVRSDERLRRLSDSYPADMPGLPGASDEVLDSLAEYLLAH